MMTLDLDKSNVCNLHFCLPHPIISFLWNSQYFVNESTKHEFLEIKLCCFWIWFPLKLRPTSPLLGSGRGIIVLLPFFGRKNGRRTDPPYSMHLAMHGEGVQHFFNILYYTILSFTIHFVCTNYLLLLQKSRGKVFLSRHNT